MLAFKDLDISEWAKQNTSKKRTQKYVYKALESEADPKSLYMQCKFSKPFVETISSKFGVCLKILHNIKDQLKSLIRIRNNIFRGLRHLWEQIDDPNTHT